MALTDAAIRAAKPQAKAYKLADEKGLYLLVSLSGGLLWRMKFRVNGVDDSPLFPHSQMRASDVWLERLQAAPLFSRASK
jgi:hypothetical protein